jgi:hypothetical protein
MEPIMCLQLAPSADVRNWNEADFYTDPSVSHF